mmetsp:Transcript_57336/g.167829  ORF Transcript_57336/g.167829 Transcript_57336/m.167829 type:complete len:381 (-) Transcript_57336:36-1178(-)
MPFGPADTGISWVSSVLTCLGSFGCLIAGAIYLKLGFEHHRVHLTVAFESVVNDWPAARAAFEGLQVTVNVSGELVALAPNHTMDSWQDDEGFVPDYSPLVYRHIGMSDSANLTVEVGDMTLQAQHNPAEKRMAVGGMVSVSWSFGGSVILTQVFPLLRASERRIVGSYHKNCGQRTGVNIEGDCWVFTRLSRLCIQVAPASGGAWRPVPRVEGHNDSYGCDFASGAWAAPQYRPLSLANAHSWHETWPRGVVTFNDIVWEVRSYMDPYFSAMELTNGTLNFGMSAAQEDVIGIVLLLLGVALMLPLGCAVGGSRLKRAWRGSDRHYRSSGRWKLRQPDPEMVGMRYAVDVVEGHAADAQKLERAINRASQGQEMEPPQR